MFAYGFPLVTARGPRLSTSESTGTLIKQMRRARGMIIDRSLEEIFMLLSAFTAVVLATHPALATTACLEPAVELLRKHDPDGYRVYAATADARSFAFWLDCSEPNMSLPAAVHETTHGLSTRSPRLDRYGFHMPDGSIFEVPRRRDLFYRNEIGQLLEKSERGGYYRTYLTGDSGKQDFLVLLDELNAYARGLLTAARLSHLMPKNMSSSDRDGLATMMYYTQLYVRQARLQHPATWDTLSREKAYLGLVQKLWLNAEAALSEACAQERLGLNDGAILKKVYASEQIGELQRLFEVTGTPFAFKPPPEGCGQFSPEDDDTETDTTGEPTTVKVQTMRKVSITVNGRELTPQEVDEYLKTHGIEFPVEP